MNYAYTNIKNLTIKNIVILGKFFKKLFFRNKKNKIKNILKNLSLCRVGVRYALPPPVLLFSRILYCTAFYKITKIVRPLWLAESVFAWGYVNMVVASKCFAFRALITQAQIWKRFDTFTLFTHSLVGWNLEDLWKHAVSIWFRLSW